nr:MAG TPA: hypothetical protein [Herelleviridae sp.]
MVSHYVVVYMALTAFQQFSLYGQEIISPAVTRPIVSSKLFPYVFNAAPAAVKP